MIGIGIVGCGYVADRYVQALRAYPNLPITGVFDRDETRLSRFCAFHGLARVDSLDTLLADARISIVINLTNPRSHFDISRECLRAGKHVYSEKPLAMEMVQAKQLVAYAESQGLWISSAPCSLLGETAQTIWRALREKRLGDVRVVYAELDDGLLHLMPYKKWVSDSGTPWPYKDEFEVGCTLEHVGYYLTWLAAFFGPVKSMTAWASVQIPDKAAGVPLDADSPDFSVACLQFESGVTARLTCSILAPHDHQMRIIGDKAILSTHDCWKFQSPVLIRQVMHVRRRQFYLPWGRRYPLVTAASSMGSQKKHGIYDWARGVADMADAITARRKPRLAPDFCLHINELALGIHNACTSPGAIPITTRFEPIDPMPWAR